jgi:hypothetical protein
MQRSISDFAAVPCWWPIFNCRVGQNSGLDVGIKGAKNGDIRGEICGRGGCHDVAYLIWCPFALNKQHFRKRDRVFVSVLIIVAFP